jgi:hypothetical protein
MHGQDRLDWLDRRTTVGRQPDIETDVLGVATNVSEAREHYRRDNRWVDGEAHRMFSLLGNSSVSPAALTVARSIHVSYIRALTYIITCSATYKTMQELMQSCCVTLVLVRKQVVV